MQAACKKQIPPCGRNDKRRGTLSFRRASKASKEKSAAGAGKNVKKKKGAPFLARSVREKWGFACSAYLLTTITTKLSGKIAGRGCGLSAVAAGRGPNFAVTV